jgi:hypothetical protein
LDLTDFFVFTKPGDPSKSIIVFDVHPSFRLDSPKPTTTEPFAPGALYEIKIDTNGDAIADICYSVQSASSEDGKQAATVRRIQGAQASGAGEDGEVIVERAPVSVAREALVTKAGDYCFFFGWRSDPFFFDVNGNFNHMQFTGDDFFANKDVCSIVLELPNSALGTNAVGIWARTVDKTAGGWIQADRGGKPLQAVFLPGEKREEYLSGEPSDDDRFIGVFAHELEHSGGYTPEEAGGVARKLLPDILFYDPREPARFPHNGRTLTDDVVDVFFSMYANRNVTDKVGAAPGSARPVPVPGATAFDRIDRHNSTSARWTPIVRVKLDLSERTYAAVAEDAEPRGGRDRDSLADLHCRSGFDELTTARYLRVAPRPRRPLRTFLLSDQGKLGC